MVPAVTVHPFPHLLLALDIAFTPSNGGEANYLVGGPQPVISGSGVDSLNDLEMFRMSLSPPISTWSSGKEAIGQPNAS